MADKKKNKSKRSDELIDIKSLIGNADGGGFSVDDILSEFGESKDAGPDLPWPQAPKREPHGKNVVLFPGTAPPQEASEADVKPLSTPTEEISPLEEPEEAEDPPSPPDNVIEFPEEESALTSFLKDLKERADSYADQMFEESENMDENEIHRLEQLIPGTDEEENEPEKPTFKTPRFPFPAV